MMDAASAVMRLLYPNVMVHNLAQKYTVNDTLFTQNSFDIPMISPSHSAEKNW